MLDAANHRSVRGEASGSEARGDSLQALERAIPVLKVFSRQDPALTLSEVAVMTGMSKASVRRILLTLQSMGFVRSDGRQFSLMPRALDLSWGYISSMGFEHVAQPLLRKLSEETGEHVAMATLDLPDMVCVGLVDAPKPIRINEGIGSRAPAITSALGRVLLADLSEQEVNALLRSQRVQAHTPRTVTEPARLSAILRMVADQGCALVDREVDAGLCSLGVPIRGENERVIASVAVIASAAEMTAAELHQRCLPPLRETADAISQGLAAAADRRKTVVVGAGAGADTAPSAKKTKGSTKPNQGLQALDRGLTVLRVFDLEHPSLMVAEVAQLAAIAVPTTRRILLTLKRLGYVRLDGRRYSLTPRVLELGASYLSSLSPVEIARPLMQDLVDLVDESCVMAAFWPPSMVYLARTDASHRLVTSAFGPGDRLPVHATAIGQVMLASLTKEQLSSYLDRWPLQRYTEHTIVDRAEFEAMIDQVALQGWASVEKAIDTGFRGIAAPITGAEGRPIAALSILTAVTRLSAEELRDRCLPPLLETTEQISAALRRGAGHGIRDSMATAISLGL